MKRVVPFSNGTEAEMWLSANCENCEKPRCFAKRDIEEGFWVGTITEKTAKYIGIKREQGNYVELQLQCNNKQGYIQKIYKKTKNKEIKNQLKLDL